MPQSLQSRFEGAGFAKGSKVVLTTGTWRLARFLGDSTDPDYLVARPYKVVAVTPHPETTILKQAALTQHPTGGWGLVHYFYSYQSRFEIGVEMKEREVIELLLARKAEGALPA